MGSQGRNPEAETEAGAPEEPCLLSRLAQFVFLRTPGPLAEGWALPHDH